MTDVSATAAPNEYFLAGFKEANSKAEALEKAVAWASARVVWHPMGSKSARTNCGGVPRSSLIRKRFTRGIGKPLISASARGWTSRPTAEEHAAILKRSA
jgi:hypothetical protein